MNEATVQALWSMYQDNEIRTEREFRQRAGLSRETYLLPRRASHLGEGHITRQGDAVWDLKTDKRARFYGASADGWFIMVVGNDGQTFEGLRRPYELQAY